MTVESDCKRPWERGTQSLKALKFATTCSEEGYAQRWALINPLWGGIFSGKS